MDLYKEIEKNFPKIEKFFTKTTLLDFSQITPDVLQEYNIGLGTMIRLKLLRPNNILYKKFLQYGFTDRCEMSMEIIEVYHKYIQRKTQYL